jgi:hypothetical protein
MLATEGTADTIVSEDDIYTHTLGHWERGDRMQSCTIITGYSGKSRHWRSINITRCPALASRVRRGENGHLFLDRHLRVVSLTVGTTTTNPIGHGIRRLCCLMILISGTLLSFVLLLYSLVFF